MCSLDSISLYTIIPVAVIIDLILNKFSVNNEIMYNETTRKTFQKLLIIFLKDSYFKLMAKSINKWKAWIWVLYWCQLTSISAISDDYLLNDYLLNEDYLLNSAFIFSAAIFLNNFETQCIPELPII